MNLRKRYGWVRGKRAGRCAGSSWLKVCGLLVLAGILTLVTVWNVPREGGDPGVSGAPEGPGSARPGQPTPGPDPNAGATHAVPDTEDWRLRLVNRWNPLPKDYEVSLILLTNGLSVDQRCYPALQSMMDDCRAAGLSPVICSGYRTWEAQESLYQNEVNAQLARGLSWNEAAAEAGKAVAVPGTSEHQLGLAVDIVDVSNQVLDESQEDTPVQRWLMEHCWEYGFILRYPSDRSEVTGIIYEPWHYRYVGEEAAAEIHALDICLEEYLGQQK